MKTIQVKKLAALAAGALFAGQAYAAGLVADTLPTDKAWYLNSAIVIGAEAKPADVVWAGNIAAAIGQMAFEAKTETVEADISNAKVKLSVPGEIVVGGEGKTYDNVAFKMRSKELDATKDEVLYATSEYVSSLKTSEEIKYEVKEGEDWKEKSYYITTKVALSNVDVQNYEGELVATVTGYPRFIVELSGLEFPYTTSGTKYVDGDNIKYITVDIAGKTYKLVEVYFNGTSGYVSFATFTDEVTVYKDQTVDLGEGYSLKLIDADKNKGEILIEITGPEGTFTETLNAAPTDFDGKLPFKIALKDLFVGTTTIYAKIGLKAETLKFDISSSSTSTTIDYGEPEEGWKVTLSYEVDTTPDPDVLRLKGIELYYQGDENGTYVAVDRGWKEGESIFIAGSDYGVTFAGFTAAPMKEYKFGSDIEAYEPTGIAYTTKLLTEKIVSTPESGYVKYTVGNFIGEKDLTIVVWDDGTIGLDTDFQEATGTEGAETTVADGQVVGFNIDSDPYADVFFRVRIEDGSQKTLYFEYFGDGYEPSISGSGVGNGGSLTATIGAIKGGSIAVSVTDGTDSGDVSITVGGVTFGPYGSDTYTETLYVYYDGGIKTSKTAPSGVPYIEATLSISVTDDGNATNETVSVTDYKVVVPRDEPVVITYRDADVSVTDGQVDYYVIFEKDGAKIEVPVLTKETTEGSGVYVVNRLYMKDKEVVWSKDSATYTIDASEDTETVPSVMYTEWGSKIAAKSETELCMKIPTEQRYLKFFVGKPSKTIETTGYIEAAVGETVQIGGTEVKIEGIEAEGASATYTTYEPMKDWSPEIVYLDTDLPNTYDKIIVVGGYYVNSVAKMLAEAYDELYEIDTEGEWIVKKFDHEGKEYIVVFGYTADDTGKAAHEFITWLRENVA